MPHARIMSVPQIHSPILFVVLNKVVCIAYVHYFMSFRTVKGFPRSSALAYFGGIGHDIKSESLHFPDCQKSVLS